MTPFYVQTTLVCIAGWLVWRLWNAFRNEPRIIRAIVAAGLISRAVAGVVLFWISYLALPIAPTLQRGDGFWFIGVDGMTYLGAARRAAAAGVSGIIHIDPTVPSVVYVRVLALFCWVFGAASSVALLLNAFAYLVTMLLLVRWARRRDVPVRAALIPICAISFLPSWVLWSIQPMKDPFFCLLVVGFAYGVDVVVSAWRRKGNARWRTVALGSSILLISIYGLAGIRWYYGLIVLCAACGAFVLMLIARQSVLEFIARVGTTIVILILSTQLIAAGAGPYLPESVGRIFRPFKSDVSEHDLGQVVALLHGARQNLDAYEEAGTRIRLGPELAAGVDRGTAPPSATRQPAPDSAAESEAGKNRVTPAHQVLADQRSPRNEATESVGAASEALGQPKVAAATHTGTNEMMPAPSPRPPHVRREASEPTQHSQAAERATSSGEHRAPAKTPASDMPRAPRETIVGQEQLTIEKGDADRPLTGAASVPNERPSALTSVDRKELRVATNRERSVANTHSPRSTAASRPSAKRATDAVEGSPSVEQPAGAQSPARVPASAPSTAPPSSTADQEEMPGFEHESSKVPTTTSGRLAAGLTAMFVPPSAAMGLGLLTMTGGRGLWLFADLDTILFDILLITTLVSLFGSLRRGAWRDPLTWYLVVTTAVITGALAYAISNYGTLFRHREMVVATLCLLTLCGSKLRGTADESPETFTSQASKESAMPAVAE